MELKMVRKIRTYDAEFWWYFAVFCALVLIISWLPVVLTRYDWGMSIGTSKPNEIGDSIGGTLGPLVALLASALTFLAFWVQYKANQQQRHDIKIERFESKFYEMLRLHTDTVKEINVAKKHLGRKSFVYLFDEFRFTYQIIENLLSEWNSMSEVDRSKPRLNYLNDRLTELAYIMFFFGVGEQSNKATIFIHSVHTPFYITVKNQLQKLQQNYREGANGKYVTIIHRTYPAISLETNYVPFDGHVSKLGHYYRHLYQMVKFIDQEELDDQYFFMKTLRAQLSNHEQLLLYYNSFFATGWWTEKLFLNSRIVKNMPLYLADVGPNPEQKFKEELKREKPNISDEQLKDELAKQLEWYKPEEVAKV